MHTSKSQTQPIEYWWDRDGDLAARVDGNYYFWLMHSGSQYWDAYYDLEDEEFNNGVAIVKAPTLYLKLIGVPLDPRIPR